MANKPKQRFVDLDVGEVSIVDSPANESEFVVIKNLNDGDLTEEVGNMADTNVKKDMGKTESGNEEQHSAAPEKVSVEVNKANDEAVAKAMGQVTELIGNISKAVGAASAKNGESAKPVEKSETDETKTDDIQKGKGESSETPTGEENAEATRTSEVEKSMESLLGAMSFMVEKAKRMTPKREAAMKAALATLNQLAKEMGMEEIPVDSSPGVSTPSGASFGASSITKALTDLTAKLEGALATVEETTKSLGERVEKIEKTRMPSQSVEDEGGTDSQTVEKSFWAGVLF
jgi:hypothetical protein